MKPVSVSQMRRQAMQRGEAAKVRNFLDQSPAPSARLDVTVRVRLVDGSLLRFTPSLPLDDSHTVELVGTRTRTRPWVGVSADHEESLWFQGWSAVMHEINRLPPTTSVRIHVEWV